MTRRMRTCIMWCSALVCGAWAVEPLVDQVRASREVLDAMPLEWIVPGDYVDTTIARTQPGNGASVEVRVSDARALRSAIGESNRRGRIRPVSTKDSVGLWVERRLDSILVRFGMRPVDSACAYRIECRINELSVRETGTYDGTFFMEAIVYDSTGAQRVHRLIKTQVRRWGPSYKARNYNQVITSLLIDWYREFWADPEVAALLRARR